MFENFRSTRYRGTIITGPWTPLLLGLFSVDTFSANVRLVFPVPPSVCFCGCGTARWSRHLRGQLRAYDDCSNPELTRVREIFFRLSSKPVIVNGNRRCWSTDSSAGYGVRRTCEHGRVGITTWTPDCPRYFPLYLLKYYIYFHTIYLVMLLQHVWSISDFIVIFRFIIFITTFFVNITVALLARLSRHLL
jgi:hypothetical protein